MKDVMKYVGLDVHKETIAVPVAEGSGGEVRYFGEIANSSTTNLCDAVANPRLQD